MQTARFGRTCDAEKSAATHFFHARFDAGTATIRRHLEDLRAAMMRDAFEPEFIGRVEIAMAELFNNISEHAYRDHKQGMISCKIGVKDGRVIAEVRDHGAPMPGHALPDGALPDLDVDMPNLPEGGFGWYIIHAQTDRITYERLGMQNLTRLTFESKARDG